MNYQDEHNDFSDAGDYNAYSDDDINDYHFAKDDDSVDPSNYDDDDDGGRRSPTESLLIRRHHQRHNTTRHELRSPPQHGINRHRGETRESFYGVDDQQAFSPQPMASIRSSSSFPSPSKRGPSRSPSPANQAPPQSTRRATTLRSVSSPHLRKPSHSLLPDLRALPPSPRLESSSFNRYRESQIGSPLASSRNSSCSARDRVYGDRPTLLSPTSRRQYLPQATPGLLSSQSPRLRSHGSDSAPFSDPIAAESLDQRRRILRESHIATDSWYRLYESLEIGTLPLPEQCVDAPPSQRLLAKIPNLKSFRKTSALGHFYISHSDTEFRCQVEIDSEGLCGKIFKKSGGSKTRLNHVTNNHPELFDALREFRSYQCMVQAIELQPEPDELDIPSTPKRSSRNGD
ncbi:MAG: hypothetical protein J3R72DRAFT_510570 [Linnemannia gamsii]|nr:MAG: hypothetical protein J3R72DRAFT_510570 [Linnemannia gamsii]